jgi:hypothetical protein
MKLTQLSSPFSIVASIVTAVSLTMSVGIESVRSESYLPLKSIDQSQVIYNAPPPDLGNPDGRQRGGASRGPCRNYESLTALVPLTDGKVWGLTASAHPTVWFYLPHPITTDTSIEFTVQDRSDHIVYNTRFTLSETPAGLMQIALPATATPLEVGKSYQWTLAIYCDAARPFASVSVSGSIQRVELNPARHTQIEAATPLEQARGYAAAGIWYDALNALATLHPTAAQHPQFLTIWTELLRQGNLDTVATQPTPLLPSPNLAR